MTLENDRAQLSKPTQEESGQGQAEPAPATKGRRGRMRWVWVGLCGVIFLAIALRFAYPLLLARFDPMGGLQKRDTGVNPEDYAPLTPFFIPMPSTSDKVAARINIRVKWDRLTGARFKRDTIPIRQRIYLYLRELERWSEDMEANRQVVEEGIARILRQALGVKDVDVLVEEIHYVHMEVLSLHRLADSRKKDVQTSNVKGVCSWMNSPVSATPYRGSSPQTRWWG